MVIVVIYVILMQAVMLGGDYVYTQMANFICQVKNVNYVVKNVMIVKSILVIKLCPQNGIFHWMNMLAQERRNYDMKLRDFLDLCPYGEDLRVMLNNYYHVTGDLEDLKMMLSDIILDEEVSCVRAIDNMIEVCVEVVD